MSKLDTRPVLTYQQLFELISKMTPFERQANVEVFDNNECIYYEVLSVEHVGSGEGGELPEGTPYLHTNQ